MFIRFDPTYWCFVIKSDVGRGIVSETFACTMNIRGVNVVVFIRVESVRYSMLPRGSGAMRNCCGNVSRVRGVASSH